MAEESIKFGGKGPAKILKWKVRHGSEIQRGSVLCLYQTENSDLTSKFKSTKGGTVLKCLVEEGTVVDVGEDVIRVQGCSHATVMKDLCALCGANLRNASGKPGDRIENVSASVAMVHSVPELIVSEEEAKRIGREDENRLLRDRKLVLLVDLDQTLLHTTNDQVPANLKDVHHFQMWHGPALMWYHTKFRPAIETFLANVSQMYELHICTFGVRVYAHIIAKILDPEGQYFSHRILSRDECFNPTSKTANLRALFPCGDSMVAIIDDREDVWNFSPNLIHVKPYQFFSGTADINAPPGLETNTADGQSPDLKRRKSRIVRVPKHQDGSAKPLQTNPAKENCSNNKLSKEEQNSQADNKSSQKQSDESVKPDEKNTPKVNEKSSADENTHNSVSNQEDSTTIPEREAPQTEARTNENVSEKKPSSTEKNACLVTGEETQPVGGETENDTKANDAQKVIKEDPIDDLSVSSSDEDEDEDTSKQKEVEVDKENEADQERNKQKDNEEDREKSQLDLTEKVEDKLTPDTPSKNEDSKDVVKDTDLKQSDTASTTKKPSETSPEEEDKGTEPQCYKDAVQTDGQETCKTTDAKDDCEYDEMVEWEDPDDYLLYLEEILTRIHTAFYECYDQTKNRDSKVELPSLKKIIPYVHKKVLKGTNIVFSGVFPTNMPAEKSRAYIVAKSLGANIQSAFVPPDAAGDTNATTHVVAARPGTQKVKQARKYKKVAVVTAQWLWTCADRWERVDERLFTLKEDPLNAPPRDSPDPSQNRTDTKSKKRKSEEEASLCNNAKGEGIQKQAKMAKVDESNIDCSTENGSQNTKKGEPQPSTSEGLRARAVLERRFSESYNPMLTFSRADIDDMDKEVEDILDASDSEEDEEDEGKKEKKQEQVLRSKVLKVSQDSSSDESLSGDFPRGWKRKYRKNSSPKNAEPGPKDVSEEPEDEERMEEEVPDQPHRILRHSSDSDSEEEEEDKESFDDSIGSADDEMAAAVEKEFLNF